MNNKGFTLMELLAVIIILSLLALLANTSVTKVVKDSKVDLYNIQLENIKLAAESWGADNLYKLPNSGECKYLTVGDLKNYGLLDSELKDPRNNTDISDSLKIKISSKLTDYGTDVITYEVNPSNIEACTSIYPAICTATTEATVTKGNIPEGKYLPGDEYICEVAENVFHNFFILSVNENKVNFIMDRNIANDGSDATATVGLVEWISKANYDTEKNQNIVCATDACTEEGPITALNYLYSATSTWTNLERIYEEHTDEGKAYGTIALNGYARLPKLSELTALSCSTEENSCKAEWLMNYLTTNTYTNVYILDGINGYWILDSRESTPNNAWAVNYKNNLTNDTNIYSNTSYGVRPVISVSKANIH